MLAVAFALAPQQELPEPPPALAPLADVAVELTGRVFLDAGWFRSGGTHYRGADGATGLEDGTEVRSARLGVHGRLHENVSYRLEYDFAEGAEDEDAVARDVWIALDDTPAGELRIGHFREPFGLEQATSLSSTTFLERGLVEVFAPGFNSGVALYDTDGERRLAWSAGLFRTTAESGAAIEDGEYALTARLTGSPLRRADGAELVHLGAALSHREDDLVRYAPRPEAHLLAPAADTGALRADDTTLIGIESAWVHGPLSLQAEYVLASVTAGRGGIDAEYSGAYAFVSWFVTGEHRTYVPERGAFGRIVPHAPLGAGPGAIELALRYSLLELDDGPSSDELAGATFGVNWYLNPNARVMLNAVRSTFHDPLGVDDSANLLLVRFQVDW